MDHRRVWNKVGSSLRVTLYAWAAVNLGVGAVYWREMTSMYDGTPFLVTAFIAGLTWVFVLLPVNILLPDTSMLRRPWVAPVFGAAAGYMLSVMALILMLWSWSFPSVPVLKLEELAYCFWGGLAGAIVALALALTEWPLIRAVQADYLELSQGKTSPGTTEVHAQWKSTKN